MASATAQDAMYCSEGNQLILMAFDGRSVAFSASAARALHALARKTSKEHKGKHQRANAEGRVFVGKTPLSELVSHKAAEVRREIVNLLGPDGENGPGFAIAQSLLPERLANRGRQLFATLVLSLLVSWDFRITEKMSAFPLLLLVFAEKPPK